MNKVQISPNTYKQVAAGILLLVIFAISYLYFLNRSVVHVVLRKEANHQESALRAEIAQLEAEYIKAQHTIASRIASLEGDQTEVKKTFVAAGDTNTLVQAN